MCAVSQSAVWIRFIDDPASGEKRAAGAWRRSNQVLVNAPVETRKAKFMSRTAQGRIHAMRWMREPSSCTRIVVIVSGLDSDHMGLIHQGFSCFDNVALIHVDTLNTAPGKLVEVQVAKSDYRFVVLGELDERFLHDLSIGKPCRYPVAPDEAAERSVIAAVEQVKSLARVSHSRHLEVIPDTCRSCL